LTVALVEIEIPARSAYVAVVRLALASLARAAGLDEEVVDDLKIAVGEACTNAVLSHEASGSDAPVTVTWSDDDGAHLIVEVGDRGPVYDPSAAVLDGQGVSTRLVMSLALLRSLVDECSITPREGGGMCARLGFRR
jgi:anti-sigma regulatory factor (Ser/Thr protein kinase)